MKKRKIKGLGLKKETISSFNSDELKGGRSYNCTYGSPGCKSLAGGCVTDPTLNATCENTCTQDSINLSNCALPDCLSTGGACA